MIIYLELKHIMAMHHVLIQKHGGLDGVRDQGLLESALAQPPQNVFGKDLFPDIYSKAAAYAFYLSENQPFVDGNKRIATAAAITFLRLNKCSFKASDKDLYDAIMKMANRQMSRDDLAEWFKKKCKKKK